jgi:rhodanese-related sulfurtransferase
VVTFAFDVPAERDALKGLRTALAQALLILGMAGVLAGAWAVGTRRSVAVAAPSGPAPVGDVAVLREAMAANQVVMVDARPGPFFQQGHLAGALNVGRLTFDADFQRNQSALQDPSKAVVVYCTGPECREAELVADLLKARGVARVRVWSGGIEAWTKAGLPLEKP